MPIPIWAGHYIGLPFSDHGRTRKGVDCWGLVRLILSEQFSIALPSLIHDYARTTDIKGISQLVTRELLKWKQIGQDDARLGDIVILRLHGEPVHVGLVLGHGRMLHVERGINAAIDRYDGSRWQALIHGFYRYQPQ